MFDGNRMSHGKAGRGIIVLIIAIILAALWIPEARSQTPTQYHYQKANADQRGTENHPLAIKIIPTDEDKKTTEQEQEDRTIKASNDERLTDITARLVWVGWFQFFVFCFQLLAFRKQADFMQQTVIEMKKASTLAMQEFVSIYRPKLRVRMVKIQSVTRGKPVIVKVEIVNVGETKARIVSNELSVQINDINSGDILSISKRSIPITSEMSGGESIIFPMESSLIGNEEWEENPRLWAYEQVIIRGFIQYIDDNGITRRTAYVRVGRESGDTRRLFKDNPDEEYED